MSEQLEQRIGDREKPEDTLAISVSYLTVQYKGRWGSLTAIEDFSLKIDEKEFISIIGPSGCGKTTLIRAIGDLNPANCYLQGEISIHGRTANEARRNNEFGLILQDPVLMPWRTALENIRLPLEVIRNGHKQKGRAGSPIDLLEMVGLKGFEGALPRELSGGMKQRIAIARMLSYSPSILLMDEPFGSLDEITREQLNLEFLRIWREAHACVLFVTHSIQEAVFLSDRVVVMTRTPGRVKTVIDVPFDRPRKVGLKKSIEFLHQSNEVRDWLER